MGGNSARGRTARNYDEISDRRRQSPMGKVIVAVARTAKGGLRPSRCNGGAGAHEHTAV